MRLKVSSSSLQQLATSRSSQKSFALLNRRRGVLTTVFIWFARPEMCSYWWYRSLCQVFMFLCMLPRISVRVAGSSISLLAARRCSYIPVCVRRWWCSLNLSQNLHNCSQSPDTSRFERYRARPSSSPVNIYWPGNYRLQLTSMWNTVVRPKK